MCGTKLGHPLDGLGNGRYFNGVGGLAWPVYARITCHGPITRTHDGQSGRELLLIARLERMFLFGMILHTLPQ